MNAIVVGHLIQTRFLTPVHQAEEERLLVSVSSELQKLFEPGPFESAMAEKKM